MHNCQIHPVMFVNVKVNNQIRGVFIKSLKFFLIISQFDNNHHTMRQ